MADWFYGKDGTQHGPVSEQKIKHLLFSNEIDGSTIVWHEGMTDWVPARQIPEFEVAPLSTHPAESSASASPASISPTASRPPVEAAPPIYAPGQATQSPNFAAPIPTNGLSIASLVCGILAILACYIWGLFGLPAVICGHLALKAIRNSATPIQGKGMAIAGLVCGYIGIALQLAMIIGGILLFANAKGQMKNLETEMQKPQNGEEVTPESGNAPIQDSAQDSTEDTSTPPISEE